MTDELTCSARGCSNSAEFELVWNNPKVHTPDRRKIWLACADHEETLRAFLSARGFWQETLPIASDAF
ncbi:MAG: acetone carboxylase [Aeromicrobium sp.]